MSKTQEKYEGEALIEAVEHAFKDEVLARNTIAVACSGGQDSMVLTHILSHLAIKHDFQVHALIVNHNIRSEAAAEAKKVSNEVSGFDGVTPFILTWEDGGGVETAIQEKARHARYALLSKHCRENDIRSLCTAHHIDDQAETFLLRLAGGSGLDGLGGIAPVRALDDGLMLIRPLLGFSKAELLEYADFNGVQYVKDPSNDMDKFARVRLRAARDALEREGLTAARLSRTANRLRQSAKALNIWADQVFETSLIESDEGCIHLSSSLIKDYPYEIVRRVLQKAIDALNNDGKSYPPRFERIEAIVDDLVDLDRAMNGRTLAGLKFSRDDKRGIIKIERL